MRDTVNVETLLVFINTYKDYYDLVSGSTHPICSVMLLAIRLTVSHSNGVTVSNVKKP